MPAEKTTRQALNRFERNRGVRSSTRGALRKARAAIDDNDPEAEMLVRQAMSALDKAAKKGVLHKNSASRRKARLAAKLNKARVASA